MNGFKIPFYLFRKSFRFTGTKLPPFLFASSALTSEEPKDWRNVVKTNYNDRIRDYSSPEKVFTAFASVYKPGDPLWKRHMTLDDFVSSLIPNHLLNNKKIDSDIKERRKDYEEFFRLVDVDSDGLISLQEYLLFSALLSIPEKHIATSFKMFDLDGNGKVDIHEFFNLIEVMKEKNKSGLALEKSVKNASLLKRFFGENFKETLTFDRFKNFVGALRKTVANLEFDLYDSKNEGSIPAKEFIRSIVAFFPDYKAKTYSKRLNELPEKIGSRKVSRKEFVEFNRALMSLDEIEFALDVFSRSSHTLKKEDFSRAVWTVTGHRPSAAQIEAIFYVFDQSGKGFLKTKDLFRALESRYKNKREGTDQRIIKKFECVKNCFAKN